MAGLQHAPYAYFENDRLSRWNLTTNASLIQWLESKWLGRALYHQEKGKIWKLTFQTQLAHLDRDVVGRELFELVSDPTDSNNLINEEGQRPRVDQMLQHYRDLRSVRMVNGLGP